MAEHFEAWPFGDAADRSHPLTAHRIAVTSSHPDHPFLVGFDAASEAEPTAEETAMLVSFLDEFKAQIHDCGGLREGMQGQPLDVDGRWDGVVFHKYAAGDWGYRRHSYQGGHTFTVTPPGLRVDGGDPRQGPLGLAELMGRIHAWGGDDVPARWGQWTAAHPDVFGPVTS